MKKILKYLLFSLLGIVLLLAGTALFLYEKADMGEPSIAVDLKRYPVTNSTGMRECNGSYLRRSSSGIWEVYLKGNPLERGVAFGRVADSLLYFQEKVFVDQIKEIIPSERYLSFLRFFTVIFNRNLGEYIPEEYRDEIYGMSQSCTSEFNYIGNPYERQLNYHAAHDIGHTMQEYMLIGCSSFGVWGGKSMDSSLLIGRNFDFYVGDNFAKNKMILFVNPDKGYKFASVGWAGMVGVLSGMNEKGLTVTLNAAKGSLPTSAATPISILAREILQYAATINEAYAIAKKRKTFVSESLLIGSAADGCAAIIEKSPDKIGLYRSGGTQIICTNHYQSKTFENDPANIKNIATSDSPYRYKRIERLLSANSKVDYKVVASILRDRLGVNGEDIGLTNEKSINQSIGHHSVIFKPQEQLMWVSTDPWQSGKFVCYDLKSIFKNPDFSREQTLFAKEIIADSSFLKHDFANIARFRSLSKYIKKRIHNKLEVNLDSLNQLEQVNPRFYYTYELIGDYYAMTQENNKAVYYWHKSLNLEIPRKGEQDQLRKKIKRLSR